MSGNHKTAIRGGSKKGWWWRRRRRGRGREKEEGKKEKGNYLSGNVNRLPDASCKSGFMIKRCFIGQRERGLFNHLIRPHLHHFTEYARLARGGQRFEYIDED